MAWDLMDEIRRVRQEVANVEEMLAVQQSLCKKEPNSFAYSLALKALKSRHDHLLVELSSLLQQRAVETVDACGDGRLQANKAGARR